MSSEPVCARSSVVQHVHLALVHRQASVTLLLDVGRKADEQQVGGAGEMLTGYGAS
jgi:hypothetical protein